MRPIVSVVIPTFDRQALTERAITSVRTRFPELVEIVVVDDAGPVPFYLDPPSSQYGVAVHILRLEQNGGPGLARSAGVRAAGGTIVAFLDSDDEFAMGWIDFLLELNTKTGLRYSSGTMIVGAAENPQRTAGLVFRGLRAIPSPFQLATARFVSVFFNPFYTPTIAITRGDARFHDSLRHCEDYYMTTVSLFQVKRLLLPSATACRLGRKPNSQGGETADRDQMHLGEIAARWAIAHAPSVPVWHKVLYPLGRAYQSARNAIKGLRQ